MSVLITVWLACAAANVEMVIAPDQPLPYVYVDDPLIVEFTSDEDVMLSGVIKISGGAESTPTTVSIGPLLLRAHGSHWHAVDGAPAARGRYRIRARLDVDGSVIERAGAFCRIDRPLRDGSLPVCVDAGRPDSRLLLAMKGVSLVWLRLNAGLDDLVAHVEEAFGAGIRVSVVADAAHAEACGGAAQTLADRVARWEIDPDGSPETFGAIAATLRENGARAPFVLIVRTPEGLRRLLEAGAGQAISGVVFCGEDPDGAGIVRLRGVLGRAGYEGLTIDVALHHPAPKDDAAAGAAALQGLLPRMGIETDRTVVDSAWIYEDGLGEGYVYLNALAHRLNKARRVGELKVPAGVRALVFRSGQQWTAVLWTLDGPQEVGVTLGNATGPALFDAWNNPGTLPASAGERVTLRVTREPCFLTGKDGSILTQAAQQAAQKTAAAFVETEAFRKRLPAETLEVVQKFTHVEDTAYDRLDFFNLLKLFRRLEELWHTHALPRSVAVPALASLSHLARHLCVIEEERGEPFVEPMHNTLAICGQFQSLYLTGSKTSSDSGERPEWLLDEVDRLMEEAKRLVAQGRPIEGGAVAVLAEWRARALEFAAKAEPLGGPEKEVAPPVEEAVTEGEAPAPQPGETPAQASAPTPQAEEYLIHVIAKGDNISKLAKKYGVAPERLLNVNDMSPRHILHIGDKVRIPKNPEP